MELEWDPAKDKNKRKKHGLAFSEAASVFADQNVMTLFDYGHSEGEDRYISLRRTAKGQALVVVHTYRKSGEAEALRIISARPADKEEELVYCGKDK